MIMALKKRLKVAEGFARRRAVAADASPLQNEWKATSGGSFNSLLIDVLDEPIVYKQQHRFSIISH